MTNTAQAWFPDRLENNPEELEEEAWIWEKLNKRTSETRIIAMTTIDGSLNYHIHIHPDFYFLEKEILKNIEEGVPKKKGKGKTTINIFVPEGLIHREELLIAKNYQNNGHFSNIRMRRIGIPIPESKSPAGFDIRGISGRADREQVAKLIQLVFGHGEWFTADVLEEMVKKSFYKQDLDLVATNQDGDIVAFCTFRMDPISKITQLEPTGTHPDYRGLGLAKALIFEGLRRSVVYGASLFYIGGAAISPAANKLYEVTGYTEIIKENRWTKEI
jgi:predicted N-acetyltransferase YhbS